MSASSLLHWLLSTSSDKHFEWREYKSWALVWFNKEYFYVSSETPYVKANDFYSEV